jgi:hypothetical protein
MKYNLIGLFIYLILTYFRLPFILLYAVLPDTVIHGRFISMLTSGYLLLLFFLFPLCSTYFFVKRRRELNDQLIDKD